MDLFGHEDPEEYALRRKREIMGDTGGSIFPTHEELERTIRDCSQCPLRKEGGLGPVLSSGPEDSPLMIVGEGPGAVEDDYGAPLIGPSGQLLDKALWSVGITRDHVYVTNIVKCRPRGEPHALHGGRRFLRKYLAGKGNRADPAESDCCPR